MAIRVNNDPEVLEVFNFNGQLINTAYFNGRLVFDAGGDSVYEVWYEQDGPNPTPFTVPIGIVAIDVCITAGGGGGGGGHGGRDGNTSEGEGGYGANGGNSGTTISKTFVGITPGTVFDIILGAGGAGGVGGGRESKGADGFKGQDSSIKSSTTLPDNIVVEGGEGGLAGAGAVDGPGFNPPNLTVLGQNLGGRGSISLTGEVGETANSAFPCNMYGAGGGGGAGTVRGGGGGGGGAASSAKGGNGGSPGEDGTRGSGGGGGRGGAGGSVFNEGDVGLIGNAGGGGRCVIRYRV